MSRFARFTLALMFVMLLTLRARAQVEVPPSINAALQVLSAALGTPITLTDLDTYNWQGSRYLDSTLGCNLITGTPIPESIVGYTYLLTYNGVIYDIRVSEDSAIAFACDPNLLDQAASIAAQATAAAALIQPCPPGYTGYLRPRLRPGIQASIAADGAPNRLRELPSVNSAQIGTIQPGAVIDVIAGPSCEGVEVNGQANLVFFQVRVAGQLGWTAEGVPPNGYYLAPVGDIGITLPGERGLITASSAPFLTVLGSIPFSSVTDFDIAPQAINGQGLLIAVGTQNYGVFNLTDYRPVELPGLPDAVADAVSVAISDDGRFIAFGLLDGTIRLFDIATSRGVVETTIRLASPQVFGALDFSPNENAPLLAAGTGALFGGGGDDKLLLIDPLTSEIVFDIDTPYFVSAVAFAPDGETLTYIDDAVHVLNTDTFDEQKRIELEALNPAGGLAYRPQNPVDIGSVPPQIVYFEGDAVNIVSAADGASFGFSRESAAFVSAAAFSLDGSLLAIGNIPGEGEISGVSSVSALDPIAGDVAFDYLLGAAVSDLAFTPDGTLLLVATGDELLFFGVLS